MDSFFMKDNSFGNHGSEAILDFQMSWLLRLVTKDDAEKSLKDISFNTIGRLLELHGVPFEVLNVQVWKQRRQIDVLAEISIKIAGVVEKHLIVIENKIYHKFSREQLDKNSRVIIDNYDFPENRVHYWLIYGNYDIDLALLEQTCKEANPCWKPIWFYDVIGGELEKPTGNALFDEFWVYNW